MRINRYRELDGGRLLVGVGVDNRVWPLPVETLGELLSLPLNEIREEVTAAKRATAINRATLRRMPPVDGRTEVWASGVTYRRSMQARMEESDVKDVYSMVYEAERPELFFKSVAWKVVGDGDRIGIRADSELNVPEPELALVLNSAGELVGLTVCNDVSSRSIEGANPLYLPQAKVYTAACALGPGIRPAWQVDDPTNLGIECVITRGDRTAWSATTRTSQLHRSLDDLVEHLFRANAFPQGAVLSTGTGIVPGLDFTLAAGDKVTIEIEHVGTLTNTVAVVP
jgi:2-dehydro-3-deoxy-D-arabinonate dehydratase